LNSRHEDFQSSAKPYFSVLSRFAKIAYPNFTPKTTDIENRLRHLRESKRIRENGGQLVDPIEAINDPQGSSHSKLLGVDYGDLLTCDSFSKFSVEAFRECWCILATIENH
jgi:hypothetical protein